MNLTIEIEGIAALKKRLDLLASARRVVGEIRISGGRNVRLARYHASDEPRTKIPRRNPFFLRDKDAPKVVERFRVGMNSLVRGERLDRYKQQVAKAAAVVRESMRSNFDAGLTTGGNTRSPSIATGTGMRPLSEAYAARKAAEGKGGLPILVWTGQLRGSLVSRVTEQG